MGMVQKLKQLLIKYKINFIRNIQDSQSGLSLPSSVCLRICVSFRISYPLLGLQFCHQKS